MNIRRYRFNYWTCSKFADWIRGEKKPAALTLDEWEVWKDNQKNNNKWRYWISDKFLCKLQNIIYFPKDAYRSIYYYIENRFVTKTHYLKTGLTPGYYHDLDYRIIHALFNELVDFVEVEQAWMNHICSKEKKFKFKKGRCPEAGIDYLNWASNLVKDEEYGLKKGEKGHGEPTHQAEVAKKILEIYDWWKNIRPTRDPHKESGWDVNFESKDKKAKDKAFKLLTKLETKYEKEDENMLINLIKIRKSLWT
jgi:hypothetical protein